jgi:signal transduction histidine kinase
MPPQSTKTNPDTSGPLARGPLTVNDLLRIERLLSRLSTNFINLPGGQIDSAIEDGLRLIVEALGIDRSTLSQIAAGSGHFASTHSWAAPGFAAVSPKNIEVRYPWVLSSMRAGKPIKFSRPDELPPEAGEDRRSYERAGTRSHVALPVTVAGELVAVLAFATMGHERTWPEALIDRLQLVAEIFANALARKQAQADVERALAFERLLTDISASLLSQRPRDPHRDIADALRSIGEFLHADGIAVWSLDAIKEQLEVTHAWVRDTESLANTVEGKVRLPDIVARIGRGEVVNLGSIEELVVEAEADERVLRSLGTNALLAIPLISEGIVVGAISLSAMGAHRAWSDALVPRLRLIGEVFAGVLARLRAAERMRAANIEAAQLRERLAHLVRVHTVGEMSGAIAHEINQPLVAIENYAHAARRRMAADDGVDRAKLVELLDKIGTQAAHAGDVLRRLRTMLKKHDSEAVESDLGRLASETIGLVEVESRVEGFQVQALIAPCLPTVLADPVQIQQVLLNLMRNAIEAMERNGDAARVLKVEVRRQGEGQVCARVIDSGPGIAPDCAERIFEPFYSTKASGLGIGLSICRSIVQAHGGVLKFAPNPEGGAVFEFTLPAFVEDD